MDYIKVTLATTQIGSEILLGVLFSNGITGVEIIDAAERVKFIKENTGVWDYAEDVLMDEGDGTVYVVFYVADESQLSLIQNEIENAKHDLGDISFHVNTVTDADWENEWKQYYKPFTIGKVTIVPEWIEHTSDDIIFRIDPGAAFGTGTHQSTRLAIDALSNKITTERIADIGCGSGILSIISLLLGAKKVFACDIDEYNAIRATNKNAELNHIKKDLISLHAGDILSDTSLRGKLNDFKPEIIIANIVADVIIELAPFAYDSLDDGGLYISTGIIDSREKDVEKVLVQCGFKDIEVNRFEGWSLLIGRKII